MLRGMDDTIAALATAPGRSAIAVVRVSGPRAHAITAEVVRPWPAAARRATLGTAHDARGERLDEVVVVRFDAPASFTGEDGVEIGCHGGLAAPSAVLAALVAAGARPALPGEFTRRAVLHGRIDLLQAEAIGDLIDARSQPARRAAVDQLDGGLSRRVADLREALIGLEALIAYDIDFPEEDDGPVGDARVLAAAGGTLERLEHLLATARAGELVRDGALVVIAGAPNAGKSSLFNALLGRRRAIVTDIPGTTRDALEAVIEGERWPLRLVDTAGLRAATDVVERLGVEVSEEYLGRADVVVACGDSAAALDAAVGVVTRLTQAPIVAVRTKCDIVTEESPSQASPAATTDGSTARSTSAIATSAEQGTGLGEVIAAVEAALDAGAGAVAPDMPMLTHLRHREAIARARDELRAFHDGWAAGVLPAPVAAVHLREAVHILEELVGAVDVEDVLARVFSTFCVGK